MYPAAIALPDELREAYLPLLLHLLYQLEQAAVVGFVAGNDVGRAAQHMVTVLYATHEFVEFLTAVSRGYHDGLAPRFAYGVEELLHQYV